MQPNTIKPQSRALAEAEATDEKTTALLFTMRRDGEDQADYYNQTVAPRNVGELSDEVQRGNLDQLIVMDGSKDGFPEIEAELEGQENAEYLNQNSEEVINSYMHSEVPAGKGAALHAAVPFIENENVVCLDSDLTIGLDDSSNESISTVTQKLLEPLQNGRRFVKADLNRSTNYNINDGQERVMKGGRITRGVKSVAEAVDNDTSFVSNYNYPLSGEIGIKTEELRNLQLPRMYGLEISTLEQLRHLDEEEVAQAQIDHSHISHGDGGAQEIAEDVFEAMNRSFHNIYSESLYESIIGDTWDEKVSSIEEGMAEVHREEIREGESDPGIYWTPERFAKIAYEADNSDQVEEDLLDPWSDYQDIGIENGRLRRLTAGY